MNNISPATPVRGYSCTKATSRGDNSTLRKIVGEIVTLIDGDVMIAHNNGFDKIHYVLPTTFAASPMNASDMRIYVYSELLMMYKKPYPLGKGYPLVELNFDLVRPVLTVGWTNGLAPSDREARLKVIREHAKK